RSQTSTWFVPAFRRATLLQDPASLVSGHRLSEGGTLIRAALMAFSALMVASSAIACSCVEPGLATQVRQAHDVFVAKVQSVKRSARVAVPEGEVVRVRVMESWKGAGQALDIATGNGAEDSQLRSRRDYAANARRSRSMARSHARIGFVPAS